MTDLLMGLAEPPRADEDAFNVWHSAHARARLSVAGVRSARRYRAVVGEPPYMVDYELDDLSVLESAPWQALKEHRPAGEQEMLDSLPVPIDRRIYRGGPEFVNDSWDPTRATAAIAVWMTVDDPDDFARWYSEEHVPLLFEVPGWLRIRRFELVEGGGPVHLALHDIAGVEALDDPRGAPARDTPWRDRVIAYRTAYERRVYQLLE